MLQKDFVARAGRSVVQVVIGAEILKHVEPNDFVISMRSFQGGLERSKLRGSISSAYVILVPSELVEGAFFAHVFKSQAYIKELQSTSNLVRDGQALRFENFSLVDLPVIPSDEQQAIAAFLDRETGKIDALVAKKKRLIELLQEKRTAFITHAVTKGLDPTAPTKPSGIDWLGDIPAHWDVKRLPMILRVQEGPGIMASDFRDDGVPLLRVRNLTEGSVCLDGCNFLDPDKVRRRWKQFMLQAGDLLISGSASMGMVSVVDEVAAGGIPYTGIFRFQPLSSKVHTGFIRHFLVSPQFMDQVNSLKTGVGIKHFGPTHLARVHVAVPPREEQARIATSLDSKCDRIRELSDKVEAAITCLAEFRNALICAAVTGSIDVRKEVT